MTKRVRIVRNNATITKDIGYSFDAEGKLALVQYPDVAKPSTYFYDGEAESDDGGGLGSLPMGAVDSK